MAGTETPTCRVAIAGASSLRGEELKTALDESSLPVAEIRLLDDEIALGTLMEAGGELTFIQAVDEDSFQGFQFVFFASSAAFAAKHWAHAHKAGATLIDLTGTLAALPTAVSFIPALEDVLPPPQALAGRLFHSPGAAALIACTLSAAVSAQGAERLVIVFFEPVSERGQPGIDELEGQTIKLLSLQPIPTQVFDTQVAFNLLAAYGESSPVQLSEVRAGIVRDVARYLSGRAVVPAIQLVQAPVFYSYAFAAYAEFRARPGIAELVRALEAVGARVESPGTPGPSNVGAAGEAQIRLAPPEPDGNVERGCWFWGAADNIRLAVANAIQIAEKVLAC